MATAVIQINGVDYTALISELSGQNREMKATHKNIKGDNTTVPPRCKEPSVSIQFTMPYLTVAERNALQAIFDAGVPVTLDHLGSMDFPVGTYVPVDFAQKRLKNLESVIYNVLITFAQDAGTGTETLAPPNPGDLTQAQLPQTFGF